MTEKPAATEQPATQEAPIPELPGVMFGEKLGAFMIGRSFVVPTLKLGQIGDRLGFALPERFIGTELGILPAGRDKNAVLYHEHQYPLICAALVRYIEATCAPRAA